MIADLSFEQRFVVTGSTPTADRTLAGHSFSVLRKNDPLMFKMAS